MGSDDPTAVANTINLLWGDVPLEADPRQTIKTQAFVRPEPPAQPATNAGTGASTLDDRGAATVTAPVPLFGQALPSGQSRQSGLAVQSRQVECATERNAAPCDYEILTEIGRGGMGIVYAAGS